MSSAATVLAVSTLRIMYWREEHQTKVSGPWCEEGQHLLQRKGRLLQQRQINVTCSFPPLLCLAVFPLTESYKMILFKAAITNWSSWGKKIVSSAATTTLLSNSPYLWQKQPVGKVWVHIKRSLMHVCVFFHYASRYFLQTWLINVNFSAVTLLSPQLLDFESGYYLASLLASPCHLSCRIKH